MKLVKSLLLGSAAGLCAVSAGQAADLPARTAAPVEYVRVCTAHGAGFFYIPGTDTCLRVGGRARFSYQFTTNRGLSNGINQAAAFGAGGQIGNGSNSGFQTLTFLNFDARTSTSYGTLRTFIRLITSYSSGGYLPSSTTVRSGTTFFGTGIDFANQGGTQISLDKAFIQFAGFTAGRATSFFDFYAHDLEHINATSSSDVSSTNLFAYTATMGGGFSATVSVEESIARRQPVFTNQAFTTNGQTLLSGGSTFFTQIGGVFTTSVPIFNAAGQVVRVANLDIVQRNVVPDVVGALRYDGAWGAAQVSAALHEVNTGKYINTQGLTTSTSGLLTVNASDVTQTLATSANLRQPSAEYGFAVQGGLKINLPQLATGDVLWLQAAYTEGALSYVGPPSRLSGTYAPTNSLTRFAVNVNDAYVDSFGKLKLTEAFSVTGAFLHYWAPEWRSAVFGSYAEVYYGKSARSGGGPANLLIAPGASPTLAAVGSNSLAFSSALRDYSVSTVGANLIWSPVRDLDIGVEAVYQRVDIKNGKVGDANKGFGVRTINGVSTGIPNKLVSSDDVLLTRFRVQRDF